MHCFKIFTFKQYCGLEILVMGHSRSLEMTPFDRSCMTSYQYLIVTMALSCTVLDIFGFEKYCDLEPQVRGHSRA